MDMSFYVQVLPRYMFFFCDDDDDDNDDGDDAAFGNLHLVICRNSIALNVSVCICEC